MNAVARSVELPRPAENAIDPFSCGTLLASYDLGIDLVQDCNGMACPFSYLSLRHASRKTRRYAGVAEVVRRPGCGRGDRPQPFHDARCVRAAAR